MLHILSFLWATLSLLLTTGEDTSLSAIGDPTSLDDRVSQTTDPPQPSVGKQNDAGIERDGEKMG